MTLESEHKWVATHSKELERFEGKHIAILNGKIIASGSSYLSVWNDIKGKYPDQLPLIMYVLKAREEQLIA